MTTTLLRRVTSTRYIFLLSGLVFILWSLATSLAPKSSILSALLQTDLDQSTTNTVITQHFADMTNADSSSAATMSNTPKIRPHLGIGIPRTHIYVISLAERQDRREQMELLRTTQNLTWTVVDAVPGNATLVNRIFDWVTLYHTESSSKVLGTSSFRWPEEINALSVSTHEPWKQSGSDTWSETSPSSKPKFPGKFGSSTYANLACATEDDSILALANDTPKWMVLSPAKVACWHSHVSAIRLFVERQDAHDRHRGDDVAVILEDDIDDISIRLSQIWTFLPAGWDIVFLGHCWSDESYYPALTEFADTYLHPSYYPKCTHAYALSLSGARRLLQHLRYPPFAYSRALDQAYAWLIRSGRLRSYSIVPSLIVQKKSVSSDISSGSGSEWREGLRDGVFQA